MSSQGQKADMDWSFDTSQLATQWTNPSGVLLFLLTIGAEFVHKAIAQTSGGIFTPVCFSFGWITYSLMSLTEIFGEGRLLPRPDYPVKVFNLSTGYVRDNQNWIIGRLFRDNVIFMEHKSPLNGNAIRISIYEGTKNHKSAAVAGSGHVRTFGFLVMALQLLLAAVPMILYEEWTTFMVTSAGTALALLSAALPQWQAEKLPKNRKSRKWFALTSGNGSKDMMVILGNGECLDLEELSAPEMPRSERFWCSVPHFSMENGQQLSNGYGTFERRSKMFRGIPLGYLLTVIVTVLLTLLWLAVIISVAGLQSHTWYLILVGGLGMFQNATIAAISRNPQNRNLPLVLVDIIMTGKVMDGLMDLEVTYPNSARQLLQEYFPGLRRPEEDWWWEGERYPYDEARNKDRARRGLPRSLQPQFIRAVEVPPARSSLDREVTTPEDLQQAREGTYRTSVNLVRDLHPSFERSLSPSTLEKQAFNAQDARLKRSDSSASQTPPASDRF